MTIPRQRSDAPGQPQPASGRAALHCGSKRPPDTSPGYPHNRQRNGREVTDPLQERVPVEGVGQPLDLDEALLPQVLGLLFRLDALGDHAPAHVLGEENAIRPHALAETLLQDADQQPLVRLGHLTDPVGVERDVDLGALSGGSTDLFSDIKHRRFVAFAFADHHNPPYVEPVELVAHGVHRRLVGGKLALAPHLRLDARMHQPAERAPDRSVTGAPADIGFQCFYDILTGRIRIFFQQYLGTGDNPRCAIAALNGTFIQERVL